MKVSLVLASLVASALAAPSFVSQYELDYSSRPREGSNSIIGKLREMKEFSRLVEVIEREKGLRDELESDKKLTVFAPTNDAFKRLEDEWRNKDEGGKMEWRDVLRYHVAGKSEITKDCMHAGALIPTNLRLKSLEDRHQRIRVFEFAGSILLNAQAHVIKADIRADNGIIHSIDNVLVPPTDVLDVLYTVPSTFSTMLAGLELTDLARKMEQEKGMTVFAPSNDAWKALGLENLKYLFSCAGQKPSRGRRDDADDRDRRDRDRDDRRDDRDRDRRRDERKDECRGRQDLRKILENHIATSVVYSTDIMEKETTRLRTMGEDLEVCAKKKGGRNSRGGERGGEHKDVRQYRFIVNNGEARITFTDGLASNAAIMLVDSVIVGDIKLPHGMAMNMA